MTAAERGLPQDRGEVRPAGSSISLAGVLPELLESVPVQQRQLAERALTARLVYGRDEDLDAVMSAQGSGPLDFLIVDGVVLKETVLAGRAALELLGPGDLLVPPLSGSGELESRSVSRYLANGPVALAALDAQVRQAARVWPGVGDLLLALLRRQIHRASAHQAMLHHPRVEDRIIAVFADLAERIGHVTADGIVIDLPMTHGVIGGLVASRRPTVSLALRKLAEGGLIERLDEDRWRLAHAVVSG